MGKPKRGEVWLVDMGYAAKVRPALVLSGPVLDDERALTTVIPHTTRIKQHPFCKSGFSEVGHLASMVR